MKRDTEAHAAKAAVVDTRRRHLPEQLTSFIGRDREIAEVRRLLLSTRLLTLTGAGGCGKMRLALQLAANLSDRFSDGVWTVDLAPLSEPALVTQTVALVLDVREGQNRSLIEALSDYLRPRHLLLLLDNCEHLIAPCAPLVETLLRAAPRLHILVTKMNPCEAANNPYDVSADGRRFLVNTLVQEAVSAPLTLVVNWTAGLKK